MGRKPETGRAHLQLVDAGAREPVGARAAAELGALDVEAGGAGLEQVDALVVAGAVDVHLRWEHFV